MSNHKSGQRPNRKPQPTPKGEAERGMQQVEVWLGELEQVAGPNQQQSFVTRLNAFLKAARAVAYYLERESGRVAGLRSWAQSEHLALLGSDRRYAHFVELRNASEKECVVQPHSTQHSVKVTERLRMIGSMDAELRDAKTGKVTARVSHCAPFGAQSTLEETVVRTEYFFPDWPGEVSFAKMQNGAQKQGLSSSSAETKSKRSLSETRLALFLL